MEEIECTSPVNDSVSNLLIPCSLELAGGECESQENERMLLADGMLERGCSNLRQYDESY